MAAPAPPPPALSWETRLRLAPGFAGRLGVGLCLGVIALYALIYVQLILASGSPIRYTLKTDFLTTLTGTQIVLNGTPALVYDRPTQTAIQADLIHQAGYGQSRLLPFIHPPFELLLVVPLRAAGLSYAAALAVWMALSVLALSASLLALGWGWPVAGRPGLLLPLAALAFYPVLIGVILGQSAAFLLLGWAAGSAALRRGADRWAGLALSLGLLKPQTLPVILLVLLLMRRWRALAMFAAVAGTALGAVTLLLGPAWPLQYLQLAASVGGTPPDPALDPALMQNWRGLLVRLTSDDGLSAALSLGATILALGAVAAMWLGLGRRDGAGWRPGTLAWDRRWAATLIVGLLASAYLLPHDLVLVLVPGWILAAQAAARRDLRLVGWLWLGWAVGYALNYRVIPLDLAPLWLTLTLAWLFWDMFRSPAPVLEPAPSG